MCVCVGVCYCSVLTTTLSLSHFAEQENETQGEQSNLNKEGQTAGTELRKSGSKLLLSLGAQSHPSLPFLWQVVVFMQTHGSGCFWGYLHPKRTAGCQV